MAVGVTILLSLAVFFLMVEEKMPVSENLPLIGKYYCSTIIEVALSLAAMCYVLWFVHHQPCALPVWKRVSKIAITTYGIGNAHQKWTSMQFRMITSTSQHFTVLSWYSFSEIYTRLLGANCFLQNRTSKGWTRNDVTQESTTIKPSEFSREWRNREGCSESSK